MSASNVVSLAFTADSSQAKREIQGLVRELDTLSTKTISSSFSQDISDDMKEAAREVGKFSTILQHATNIDTGKLDLSKLNQGLKAANSSIPQMANSFKALGNDGVKAFANIVKQINAAEVPMKKTNAMVDKLWTSMKNTVNWQISSSALHALMSGIQGAFRYAEDLNRSLNDIRIVTEYNAEQMAAFASEANKAAKALSTTTTAYTDASLIYFQQGLNKEEVKERADITIKMANVTRQSATEVSNQLTSIWNNFDDGTQSLEYYADILTKLGAATASSTEEIAGGLEKFAAVADTIGLSYEYAASALATITSNTRQSEEVVGTALKTIFARIQGLNLGETLDDGTTLNKYSAALESVGISIFDQSGELKNMDRILDEMGAKWETLSKNQQVALAQTVAGVRQYNQLVSLMDNWDNGDADSMAANLSTARGASGALQTQADIYADSWEAAQKRVQASWESLYDTLIDDDFFVDLLDTVSGFVDVVDNLINGLGGVKGLLLTISTYILTIAKTKFSDELKRLTGPSEKQRIAMAKDQKTQANEQLRQIASGSKSNEGQVIAKTYGAISDMNQKMYDMSDKLTEEEAKIFQGQIDQIEALGEIVAAKAKVLDLTERENKSAERQLQLQQKIKIAAIEKLQGSGNLLNRRGKAFSQEEIDRVNQVRNSAGLENLNEEQTQVLTMDASKLSGAAKTSHLEKYKKVIAEINAELERAKTAMRNFPQSLKTYETKVKEIAEVQATMDFLPKDGAEASEQVMAAYSGMSDEMKGFVDQAAAAANKSMPELIQQLSEVKDGAIENSDVFQDLSAILSSAREQFAETTVDLISGETGMDADEIMGRTMAIDEQVDSSLNLAHAQQQLQVEIDKVNGNLDVNATKLPDWQDSIVGAVSAVTALMGALSSISGMMDTLKDPDVSGWEKFTTVLMTLATVIPSIVMAFKSLKESKIKDVAVNALNVASEKLLEKAKERSAKASAKAKLAQEQETKAQKKDILTNIAQSISEKKAQAKEGLKKTGQSIKNYKGLKGTFGAGAGGSAAGGAGGGAAGGAGGLTAGGASLAISIGLIAAGIAVLAGGIAWAVHQAKAAERAVEKAKQAATELSENYDSVKASFDEFNNQASGYESARDAVDKLTVGTEEYAEAVRNANDVAMQLLETNKDLAYTIQDGQIIIDEESLKQQKEIEQQKLEHAQAAKMAGQVNLTRAEEDLQKRDMARKLDSSYDDDESVGNVLGATGTGAAAGALIGTAAILPGIGTLVGGLIGAGVGLIGGMIADAEVGAADSKESEALEKLEKAYLEDDTVLQKLKDGSMTDADWDKIGIDDAELRASLQANADEVSTLVQEMAANTAAVNAQNDLVAANALADNEAVQDSEYQDQIIDLAGDAYGYAYDKAMESEWVDSWGKDGIAQINGANKEAKKVFDEYLKYAGLEGQGYELTDTTGNDDNRKFVYKDKEGNEHEVSLEAMQAARAAYEASGVLNESATKLAETFTKLADSTSQADQALLSFVSGKNFEEATEGELEAIQNEVGPITKKADGTYQTGNVENYLEKALGEELTDDVAIRYGYESADAMLQAFAAKLSDADEAWDSIKVPENFKFSSEMSLSTAKALESQIKDMNLGPLGEEAGKEYVEKLNTMLEGVDTEDQQKALKALTEIDWSDWDAMEQADRLMKEYGVDIDTASEEWVEFAEKMRLATGARPDFEKLKETLQNISGILKDLNFGDIISEEDYQELIAYNDEWERFFMMQADGTRKFIGNSAAMRQETRDSIAAQKKDLEQRKKNQEGMKNANWSINGKTVDWHDTDSFSLTGAAKNLKNASDTGATGQVLATLGYTDEVIQEMIDDYNEAVRKGDEEAIKYAEERFETMYHGIGDFLEEDLVEMGQELDEMMASTAINLSELNTMVEDGTISVDAYAKQFQVLAQEAFSSAETLAELDAAMDQFQLDENDELYTQNLIRIAEGYKSCADELTNYQAALSNFDPETGKGEEMLEQAEATLRAMIALEEAAKQYGLEVEVLTAQAKRLAKAYGLTEEEAAKLAVQNQRMNKGVDALTDNWEDWKKELSSSNKLTQDYAEAVVDCTAAIADLVGACEDLELPDEFFNPENMELIEKAMDGDTDAINKLGAEVAKVTVEALDFKEAFAGLIADMKTFRDEPIEMDLLNRDKFEEDKLTVLNGIDAIREGTMSAGEAMSGEWVAALNRMALTTGMSVEEMNGLLGSLGVQAKVETTYVPQEMQVPTYTDVVEPGQKVRYQIGNDPNTGEPIWGEAQGVKKYTVPGEPVTVEGYAAVAQISTEDNPLTAKVTSNVNSSGAPAAKYTGNRGSVAPSVTKSGKEEKSGGNKKKQKKPEKTELGERYKEIDDALSDVADSMEDASKQVDRLYGNARIAKMKQVNGLIQSEVNLLRQKKREAESNLITDKQALELAAKNANVTLSFDSEGNIENYTSALKIVEDRLNAVKNAAYSTGNEIDDGEQETIDDLEEKAQALEDAIAQYDETRGIIRDTANTIDDKFNEWQDNNYDMLTYSLELELQINDSDLEKVEYYLGAIEDDFYSIAEAAALMVGDANMAGISQLDIFQNNLADQAVHIQNLQQAYADNAISQSAFVEGMQESQSAIYENLTSIRELDKTMKEYYAEALDQVNEKLDEHIAKIDHVAEKLDHYKNIMSTLGKDTNYDAMNTVLEGIEEVSKNSVEAAKGAMNLYNNKAQEQLRLYQEALAKGDQAAAEMYYKYYTDALNMATEAEKEYMSSLENWAQAARDVLDNKLSGFARDLEKSLTGGSSFDQINTQMERAVSLQEEYLTTTNQIYETNKMMRTAQQELDKSTSSVAKSKLSNFIKETEQLQNQGQLSQYELDIQQAKYDLLLAEIALQDAQESKSVVRLQRDAEGNFGYVYTADQSQVDQAQQQFEDAQNALYNIGLEGANNYTEKYQQTLNDFYNTMTELNQAYLEGAFSSEAEYQAAVDDAKQQYYAQLQNYSKLYSVAIATDSRVVAEAWSTDFADMTTQTDHWMQEVDGYVYQVEGAFNEWNATVATIEKTAGTNLDKLATNVTSIVDESDKLINTLNGKDGLINSLSNELTEVTKVTSGYAAMRQEILGVISAYEIFARSMGNYAGSNNNGSITFGPFDNSGSGGSGNGSGGSGNGSGGSGGSGGSSDDKGITYTVQPGDTLSEIGAAYGVPWQTIYKKNKDIINDPDLIFPGQVLKFDSGGYTGEWGSYGKLAVLHEKELVLNAHDTENLLTSLTVLDSIMASLELQSQQMQYSSLMSPNYGGASSEVLEQKVHIEASFPNVSSHGEIEEALNNLINQASQYANRK